MDMLRSVSSVVAASMIPGSYWNGSGGLPQSPTRSWSSSSGIVDGVSRCLRGAIWGSCGLGVVSALVVVSALIS